MIQCRYSPPRHRSTTLVLGALVVLAGAIFLAVEFEQQVRRVNWAIVTGVCGAAFLAYLFVRWANDSDSSVEPRRGA